MKANNSVIVFFYMHLYIYRQNLKFLEGVGFANVNMIHSENYYKNNLWNNHVEIPHVPRNAHVNNS